MMKLRGTIDGRPAIVLGLSHGNLDRLRADGLNGCIAILAEDFNVPFDIIITAAETERELFDAFQGGIGPNTELHLSKEFKS